MKEKKVSDNKQHVHRFAFALLIILINLGALGILSLIFLGAFSTSPDAEHPITENQIVVRKVAFGVIVSTFFATLVYVISYLFNKNHTKSWRAASRQFFFLVAAYIIMHAAVIINMMLRST